MQLLIIAINMH